jgi:hypothetical protein
MYRMEFRLFWTRSCVTLMLVAILMAAGASGQQGGINTSIQAISSSSAQGNTSASSMTSTTSIGFEPGQGNPSVV